MSAETPERDCRVVLMGMMGSGKSTIGRELSRRTGWSYHDNDKLLNASTGRTAAEVLAGQGEAGLREAEAAALALGMTAEPPCFVGIAAGTILSEENRGRLKHGVVIWLRATPETLYERARGTAHRPWLDRGGVQWFRTTLDERWPLYDDAADIIVDVDEPSPEELADLILERLAERPACKRQLAEVYDRSPMRHPNEGPSIWARPRQIGALLGVVYGLLTFIIGLPGAGEEPGLFTVLVFDSVWNGILGFIVGFLVTVVLLTYARVMRD